MSRFPTAGHLVSWAGLCPSARQSGTRTRAGKKGHGDTWLRAALGQAATGAARTATFVGERYHRIARRRGKAKAQVAVARSILVIVWHLLADPTARYADLGPGYYAARTDVDRTLRNHIRQIQALTLDIEPPEALCPETKGQAASVARVRDHPLHGAGRHGGSVHDPEYARNGLGRRGHVRSNRSRRGAQIRWIGRPDSGAVSFPTRQLS